MSGAPNLDVAKAAAFNRRLAIAGVGLLEVHGRRMPAKVGSRKLGFDPDLEPVSFADAGTEIICVFPLRVLVFQPGASGEKEGLAELRVTATVSYAKQQPFGPEEDEAVHHFVGITGWMHAWPYLRAEVQALSTKLGLPPLVLPVLLAGQTAGIRVARLDGNPELPKAHAGGRGGRGGRAKKARAPRKSSKKGG